ncbi:sensor domain-containing diguanylate cyclase [Bacillus massiliigorillae]|uniref:sensor domain-containing diguanylate cyclase n=1 Tax=Bacillus massiliigorillae TaxID=1243664 RepID=UPI00039BB873|nr:diguanylate cyclase [Bacillus massiliigorillae]
MSQHNMNDYHSEEILAMMPIGIHRCYIHDCQYRFDFVNEGFVQLLGCSQDEITKVYQNDFFKVIYENDCKRVERSLNELCAGKESYKEVVYRLARQDGKLVWVNAIVKKIMGVDGDMWLYSIITDITSFKVELEELQVKVDGYRKITEHLDEVFFEWDIIEDNLKFSPNFVEKFGYEPILEEISSSIPTSMHVHPEDVSIFVTLLKTIQNGAPYAQSEFRIKKYPDKYLWCKVKISSQSDKDGKVYKAFGTVSDINDQKQTLQKLLFKAQRDPLTGIYNKTTTQSFMEECLTGEECHKNHALFIIDIDDFKRVNDHLGHLFGDAVLKDTAINIQHQFRDYDIVGRIGGDEFAVLLKNIPSEKLVIKKSESLIDTFRRSFTGHDKKYKISGSIGVAIYPRDGKTFNELFQNADNALYAAKKQGKDSYCIFSKELKAEKYKSVLDQANLEEVPQKSFTDNLIEYIFKILYETKDMKVAVPLISEIIGKYYGVSRVYVCENSEDDLSVSNTFEWCNEGIESVMHSIQNFPYTMLVGEEVSYKSLFNENGVFYCKDIHTLPKHLFEILDAQNIRSLIQCSMELDGRFKGFIGFDECSGLRLWTKEEIDMLTVISQILSTFLLKKRSEKELAEMYQLQKSILDHIDAAIYAINPDTYEVFYFNEKTKSIVPMLKKNDLCYKVFWNESKPCEQCPMKGLNDKNTTSTLVRYDESMDICTNLSAAYINWLYGQQGCLLTRFDINKYHANNLPCP